MAYTHSTIHLSPSSDPSIEAHPYRNGAGGWLSIRVDDAEITLHCIGADTMRQFAFGLYVAALRMNDTPTSDEEFQGLMAALAASLNGQEAA